MKNMEITDIRIKKVASEGKMKAVASVTFDNAFAVHDVKVIEGPEKLFVAMPSRRTPDGEYRDIAHPINSDMRNMLRKQLNNIKDRLQKVICLLYYFIPKHFFAFSYVAFSISSIEIPFTAASFSAT